MWPTVRRTKWSFLTSEGEANPVWWDSRHIPSPHLEWKDSLAYSVGDVTEWILTSVKVSIATEEIPSVEIHLHIPSPKKHIPSVTISSHIRSWKKEILSEEIQATFDRWRWNSWVGWFVARSIVEYANPEVRLKIHRTFESCWEVGRFRVLGI